LTEGLADRASMRRILAALRCANCSENPDALTLKAPIFIITGSRSVRENCIRFDE
jgi:hypothetical protein